MEEGHEVLWVTIAEAVPGNVDIEPGPLALPHFVVVSVRAAGIELAMVIPDRLL